MEKIYINGSEKLNTTKNKTSDFGGFANKIEYLNSFEDKETKIIAQKVISITSNYYI